MVHFAVIRFDGASGARREFAILKTIGFDTLLGAKVHQTCEFWQSPELAISKTLGFDTLLCFVDSTIRDENIT